MKLSEARKYRAVIETAVNGGVDDRTASTVPGLFPALKGDGSLVKAGTRICWNGAVRRAAADLWDRPENAPDNAPALWEDLEYRDGYRLIPENITVTAAFSEGECGWWKGLLYRSLADANVYNPDQYAPNWELVDGE